MESAANGALREQLLPAGSLRQRDAATAISVYATKIVGGSDGTDGADLFPGSGAGPGEEITPAFASPDRPHCYHAVTFFITISRMPLRRFSPAVLVSCLIAGIFGSFVCAQQPPPASGARILLLPRKIISGERATLAVLDVNGRLTPGVTVNFSNGDRFTTDATGRALFVAPLNPGVIFGSIAGRTGRVATSILPSGEAASASLEVSSAPRVASLTDRFEILGKNFCGDADANQVTIAGQSAFVLASSPVALK